MNGMNRLWLALSARTHLIVRAACLVLLAAALPGLAPAQPAEGLKLEAIDVQTLPGQQLQLRLRLNGPAPEPLSFTIDRPARIALDLPNTALALDSRRIDVNSGGVATILAAEAGGRTRLVLNLDQLMPYQTRVEGNNILVNIGGSQLLSQDVMRQIMADGSNTRPLVVVDHQGKTGLDAAAYFMGHGLQNVRCLRGGIDAWAQEVESTMRRYTLG